jgi:hypothetical protein
MQVLRWYRGYHRLDSPSDYPIQHEVAAFRVALEASDVPALGMRSFEVREWKPPQPEHHEVWVSGRRRAAAEWGDVGATWERTGQADSCCATVAPRFGCRGLPPW